MTTLRTVYTLLLENNKIYVGETRRPVIERFMEHKHRNNGAGWTSLHSPVDILDIKPNVDEFEETFQTIRMMKKYGIYNVRGGPFSKVTLTDEQLRMIEILFQTIDNRCVGCNSVVHFISDCPQKQSASDSQSNLTSTDECHATNLSDSNMTDAYDELTDDENKQTCYNCKQSGHISTKCPEKIICRDCKQPGHKAFECPSITK